MPLASIQNQSTNMPRHTDGLHRNVALAGIKVTDTSLIRDAVELSRSLLEPYLFNHVRRSIWYVALKRRQT